MVLELLVNPKKVTGKPSELMILGFIYAFVSIFLALWIFKSHVSIVMVTLTIIASIPLVRTIISMQEKKDMSIRSESTLLKEHSKAILAFTYLFLGYVAAFTILYVFMPASLTEKLFSVQIDTILAVRSTTPVGNFIGSLNAFGSIFLNNIKSLFFVLHSHFFMVLVQFSY